MSSPNVNLLTHDDLALVESIGFPIGPRPDLHMTSDEGELIFTIKGLQFYRAVLAKVGLEGELAEVRTSKDLYALKQRGLSVLAARASAAAARALDKGDIPAQRRQVVEEALHGTIESFIEASAQHERCAAAGENVIPASFKKNTAD